MDVVAARYDVPVADPVSAESLGAAIESLGDLREVMARLNSSRPIPQANRFFWHVGRLWPEDDRIADQPAPVDRPARPY